MAYCTRLNLLMGKDFLKSNQILTRYGSANKRSISRMNDLLDNPTKQAVE